MLFEKAQTGEDEVLVNAYEEIKNAACTVYGVQEQFLGKTVRGQFNEPRNLAIYLCRKLSGEKLDNIAKAFALGSYSSVAVRCFGLSCSSDRCKALDRKLYEIREEISKSQAKT